MNAISRRKLITTGIAATAGVWQDSGDKRLWRLIVSPENASKLDLMVHARDLVASMERDLGTRLEWVGVDHHNTDNPHVHILIRGLDERGWLSRLALRVFRSQPRR